MRFNKQKLQNGLTIITVPVKDSTSVTCLVLVKTGSKYETKEINGLSHFLEHMCFKGTEKRPKPIMIATELDSIGSQNNAFTSQEYTGYYAKSHPKYLDIIMDVVSDIYLHPTFDAGEIEKEKGVIIEEINMYDDMPHAKVHNVFMEALYGDQPAGWSILGPKENIKKTTQNDFIEYRKKHYVAEATTVVVSGNFDETTIVSKIEELFAGISESPKEDKLPVIENQEKPVLKVKQKETDQTHIVLGVRTFGSRDDRNITLKVLRAILGGGMSGRLWRKLREEMGSCYYVSLGIDEYTDHGYVAVSAGIDLNRIEEVTGAILGEFIKMKEDFVSAEELQKAKDYTIGNMYLGLESSDSLGEYYVSQDILGEDILTPDELAQKIQSVTAEDVQKLAQEIFVDKGLNMAVIGNIKSQENMEKVLHF